jgi:(p)ppGpp synthase/HD superfamily hydrolase
MRRDTLELADDSLFIERVKGTFTAADAELVIRAHAFLSEKACADDSTARKAAALLIEQDADATAVAAALLPPLLWQECIDPSEIGERFGSTVAASIEDLGSPLIPTTDDRQLRRRDIYVILTSIGGVPRKVHLFITDRLSALQKAIGSTGGRCRKMARTGKPLPAIMDRIGLRVVVASVPECFTVLGLLHAHFKPIPGTFDDYIGLPKDKGYPSLHTCVYPVREVSHKPIAFQMRTKLMASKRPG